MAIIISKNGRDARKIEQSGVTEEGYLQQYISHNPDSLPLGEMKDDARLMVIGREFSTRSGPIDVLAVDGDGDLYVIETKLYKNPDKRLVVAQMLDYGASLWKGYPDPDRFIAEIEARLAKTADGGNFAQRLGKLYGLAEAEAVEVIEAVKRNLIDGSIKFVVLMDRLHENLRDLILFVNEKSRFDILAVEMEFYRHDGLEIVIPKLFGAEVRKEVSAGPGSGGRRKWDEASFFAHLSKNVTPEQAKAVRRLYEFSLKNADGISWGTGTTRGSFNPKFLKVNSRSLYSVFSDGSLVLNFGWLGRSNAEEQSRDRFKVEVEAGGVCKVPANYADEYVPLEAEDWVPKVGAFETAVDRLLQSLLPR